MSAAVLDIEPEDRGLHAPERRIGFEDLHLLAPFTGLTAA
jgi:hypothetical protein